MVEGRPTPLPPGIAARVDITPESVQHAAENFATGQQHLADAWMRLRSGLDANAGMAGTGEPAKAFAGKYDAALKTSWKGFGAGIIHLGGTSKGLTQMANNHLKADHHSRADRPGGAAVKLPFARVYPSMSMAVPAPAMGRGGSGLPGPLAKLWPNASVARLKAAAGVWRAAAKEIHSIGDWLNWTIGTITDTSSGPDIDAMYDYYGKIWTPGGGGVLGKLEDACSAMADACEQYAGKVRGARTKMKWELVGAGIGVALTTAGGLILTAPTGGGSDAPAGVADAAEVTAVLSPTAHELVSSVTAMMLSLLSGDIIGALTIALSTIPTITLIETEVEEELEPALEDGMAATEGTATGWRSIFDSLKAGRQPGSVKVVDNPTELRNLFDTMTRGGEQMPARGPKIPEVYRLSDGTVVQWRTASKSGGETIDIFPTDSRPLKVHVDD
ncbi:hypothetical protein NDW01_10965 [Actinoallomurus sp. WRP6H-15]|uniref:WXG100-like domain-containing protein n=1 Tax=Actinoallomurus soli TaxID=2952535 RepID=UPI0020930A72|nr:hypothetical protein [Actinoallomurus soli]MCO5968917.1 hypothetical protein [Actinoallomurus soli]